MNVAVQLIGFVLIIVGFLALIGCVFRGGVEYAKKKAAEESQKLPEPLQGLADGIRKN